MHEGFSLTQTSWIALLSIAHHYEFPNVHKRTINEIYHVLLQQQEQLQHDHPLLISVGEKYDMEPWYMVLSLIGLVMQVQPLMPDKVVRFSSHTVSQLTHVCEDFVHRTVNPPPEHTDWLNRPNEHLTVVIWHGEGPCG